MPDYDRSPELNARKQVAGRIGFTLGCIAAIVAAVVNFARVPRPLAFSMLLLIVLVSALNIPFGIAMGLLGERLTRRGRKRR
jgi:hypothetical protein